MNNELKEILPRVKLKNKNMNTAVVVLLILAVFFLGFSGCEKSENEKPINKSEVFSKEEYKNQLEVNLKNTLKRINGAGEVSVLIYIDSGGEKILATDERGKTDIDNQSSRKETEESVVLSGKGSEQAPYVIKEKLPEPVGVIVVADGARDEKIKYEMYDAVKALYGLPAHRIWITY